MTTQTNPDAPEVMVNLLSIDAWRYDGGWTWNQWHSMTKVPVTMADLKPRALLAQLRKAGYLGEVSKGKIAIEDDGYNVVIMRKSNRMPLYAIAYGEVLI